MEAVWAIEDWMVSADGACRATAQRGLPNDMGGLDRLSALFLLEGVHVSGF